MLESAKKILCEAKEKNKAIGAFNATDPISARAIIEAAVEMKSPVIIQVTKKTFRYNGAEELAAYILKAIELRSKKIPIALHLDHGKSFEDCKNAIECGVNSVMIDGSRMSFEDNVNITKRVVEYAHKNKICVQGELGTVPYITKDMLEDDSIWDDFMTNPDKAIEFIEKTQIDVLAVAIGNAHGFQKERSEPDWDRLEEISQKVKLPLVLHGSSSWDEKKIRNAINKGISCFNVDTNLRMSYIAKLCEIFENECRMEDPRVVIEQIQKAIKQKVIDQIKIYNNGHD
jgi:ketose-bisphosphate aldolase